MSAPFDAAAASYDAREAANPLMLRLRERSLATLLATFPPGARLLDVGAGTGTEAIALARAGRRVLATDPSAAMLDALRAKARAAGVDVPAVQLAAGELAKLDEEFDGAYSSFGALNGEPDLRAVATELARLVRPGGAVVASVLNRWPPASALCHVAAFRPRDALDRFRGRAVWRASPEAPPLEVRYHSLRALRRAFSPEFQLERAEALALLLPPPGAARVARAMPRAVGLLARADGALATRRGVRALGDHHLVTFRRAPLTPARGRSGPS